MKLNVYAALECLLIAIGELIVKFKSVNRRRNILCEYFFSHVRPTFSTV